MEIPTGGLSRRPEHLVDIVGTEPSWLWMASNVSESLHSLSQDGVYLFEDPVGVEDPSSFKNPCSVTNL